MTVGGALRAALRDFYEQSWRLLILNSLLGIGTLAVLTAAVFAPAAVVLVVLLGPPAAALMHCSVTLVRDGDFRLSDAVVGLRLHWRRGLALGGLGGVAIVLTFTAVRVYGGVGAAGWPLTILVLYLALLFSIFQLPLWPLAVFERDEPLRHVLRDAGLSLLRRPGAWTGLAVALFLVNVAGVAAAVLPFLTLTIAYSFLAAARFALPPKPAQEM
jgi:hypothetical protein